jgi:hypothetical protein
MREKGRGGPAEVSWPLQGAPQAGRDAEVVARSPNHKPTGSPSRTTAASAPTGCWAAAAAPRCAGACRRGTVAARQPCRLPLPPPARRCIPHCWKATRGACLQIISCACCAAPRALPAVAPPHRAATPRCLTHKRCSSRLPRLNLNAPQLHNRTSTGRARDGRAARQRSGGALCARPRACGQAASKRALRESREGRIRELREGGDI